MNQLNLFEPQKRFNGKLCFLYNNGILTVLTNSQTFIESILFVQADTLRDFLPHSCIREFESYISRGINSIGLGRCSTSNMIGNVYLIDNVQQDTV